MIRSGTCSRQSIVGHTKSGRHKTTSERRGAQRKPVTTNNQKKKTSRTNSANRKSLINQMSNIKVSCQFILNFLWKCLGSYRLFKWLGSHKAKYGAVRQTTNFIYYGVWSVRVFVSVVAGTSECSTYAVHSSGCWFDCSWFHSCRVLLIFYWPISCFARMQFFACSLMFGMRPHCRRRSRYEASPKTAWRKHFQVNDNNKNRIHTMKWWH